MQHYSVHDGIQLERGRVAYRLRCFFTGLLLLALLILTLAGPWWLAPAFVGGSWLVRRLLRALFTGLMALRS